jgi:hypothetical protein
MGTVSTSWLAVLGGLAATAGLVLALADGAGALEVNARGVAYGEAMMNTDLGAAVVDGRIDFEVDVGTLTFGGAYRSYDFGQSGYNPRGIAPVHDLKHRYVEAAGYGLQARAGHWFATFGRGLTLRSFEQQDLEHDTALDGFKAEYRRNRYLLSVLSGRMTEDVTDLRSLDHGVRGGRLQVTPVDGLTLAATGMDRDTEREDREIDLPDSVSRFGDQVYGGEVEIWLGSLSLAAEHARKDGDHYPQLSQGGVEGRATYITGSLYTSRLSLVAEYKDFERFEHMLVNPPTCVKDHLWALMNRVTHEVDLDDERGFLGEGTITVSDRTLLTGGASEARTQAGGLEHWEIYGQMQQTEAVWGLETLAASWSRSYASGKYTEHITGVVDTDFAPWQQADMEVTVQAQRIKNPSGETFENYLGTVACYPGQSTTVSLQLETSTQENIGRDFWAFGLVRVALVDDFEVSMGAGTQREGRKCSGGICFTEPEFAGMRLRFSKSF